jgi:hypothetical protein
MHKYESLVIEPGFFEVEIAIDQISAEFIKSVGDTLQLQIH